MKKTLLLAAALACSGVAQADNFVCTAESKTDIYDSGTVSINYAEFGITGPTYFVDTSRGFRDLRKDGTETDFEGECVKASLALFNCKYQDNFQYSSLSVRENDGQLKFLKTRLVFGTSQSSAYGTCLRL